MGAGVGLRVTCAEGLALLLGHVGAHTSRSTGEIDADDDDPGSAAIFYVIDIRGKSVQTIAVTNTGGDPLWLTARWYWGPRDWTPVTLGPVAAGASNIWDFTRSADQLRVSVCCEQGDATTATLRLGATA